MIQSSTPPRIAIISSTAPPTSGGGVGTAHYNLFRALRENGLNVELFLFFQRGTVAPGQGAELEEHIHRFGPPTRPHKALLILSKLVFALLAPGKIAWNTVDVLASAIGVRRMNPALAKFDPDIIILPDHGAPGLALRHHRDAVLHLISHHNPLRLAEPSLGNYSQLDARIAVWLEQRVVRNVSKVVCPSHHMKDWFERTYRFDGDIKVIPNIVFKDELPAAQAADLRGRMGLAADATVIGIPSAQTRVKGSHLVPDLIREIAAASTKEVGFFLPGEIDPGTQSRLSELEGRVRVFMPGRLSHNEFLAAFKSCDFGLFPSLRDNYSMALVEASMLGIPMVAFNSGGNADIIEHGHNGLLAPEPDPQGLVAAASSLINDPQELEKLRKSTKDYAATHFDSSAVAGEYIRFLSLTEK